MAALPVWLCSSLLLLVVSTEVEGGTFCYQNSYSSLTYCNHGCCGSYGSQYCCGWSPTVGLIIGCVMAGIVLIAVIVAIVCCCMKHQSHGGQVIAPAGAVHPRPAGATVISSGAVTVSAQNASVYPPPPPPPISIPQPILRTTTPHSHSSLRATLTVKEARTIWPERQLGNRWLPTVKTTRRKLVACYISLWKITVCSDFC